MRTYMRGPVLVIVIDDVGVLDQAVAVFDLMLFDASTRSRIAPHRSRYDLP